MSALTVRVWRNYGRVRLYVSAGDDEIGWYDPQSGKYELTAEEMAAEFWAAAMAECQRQSGAGQLAEPVLPPAARRPAATPPPAASPPRAHAPPPPASPPPAHAPRAAASPPPAHAPRAAASPPSSHAPRAAASPPRVRAPRPAAGPPPAHVPPRAASPSRAHAPRAATGPPGTAEPEPIPATEPLKTTAPATGPRPAPGNGHWMVRNPQWEDLAVIAPGSAARVHAAELRREHPVLTPLARMIGIRTTASRFAMGAKGERVVGRKLNRWAGSSGWHVMHAVPVGNRGTDIDHVIIGPFGMVTVNTKTTASTVWVGEYGMKVGRVTVDYLRKSRAEARRAARLMSRATGWQVPVQPVIVFVGARKFTRQRGGPPDIAVLPSPRALHRWLRRQRPVLGSGEVAELYAIARRPDTWQDPRPRSL